jgi:AcrR family transcriptional regulator
MTRSSRLLEAIESAGEATHPSEPSTIEKRILKHAMRSFARRGYAATTLRGVAADAGVTAPLLSYYFKTKENLFREVAEIVMWSLEQHVAQVASGVAERPFAVAIEAIVEAHLELCERSEAALEFLLALLYGPMDGQPAVDLDGLYAGTRRTLERAFERAIVAGELVPRAGVGAEFLVERFTSLIHDLAVRRFRIVRMVSEFPERREEIVAKSDYLSTRLALEHFFLGLGDVPAWRRTESSGPE